MISKELNESVSPALNSLVLAGGKSVRMGKDKGLITWHDKPQRYYMADLLQLFCKDVYISCRQEQINEMAGYRTISDSYTGTGSFGGILSAFKNNPDVAWLVTACDLPLLDNDTIHYLIYHRDKTSIATAFISSYDGLPEPLITIWEPKSLPILLSFLEQGIMCPRKVLIRSAGKVKLLQAPNPDALTNANTIEDAAKVRSILTQKINNES